MSTDSCERCGAPAPEALLRNVSLHVDGNQVDTQTICPDCFADWIAHYQEQMAGDMPSPGDSASKSPETGGAAQESTDHSPLCETVRTAREQAGPGGNVESHTTLSEAVAEGATNATPPATGGSTAENGGEEIQEVGTLDASTDDGVEVDLDAEVGDREDDDDDDGLIVG